MKADQVLAKASGQARLDYEERAKRKEIESGEEEKTPV